MDIRQLSYFAEVAKHKSFTKASQTLYLSQSTISKMIKNLEEELGVILIDRSGKQIELTDEGEIVFDYAQDILHRLDDLSASLYDVMHLKKGKVKIGLPPVIGTLTFPSIMMEFRRQYPEIHLELAEVGAKKVEQYVEDREVDFGVVMLPVEETKFDVVPFVQEDLWLLIHASHPLAKSRSVSLAELSEEDFLLLTDEFTLPHRVVDECRQAGFEPKISYQSSQWDFIAEMISKNLGVTLFPKSICERYHSDDVKTVPLSKSIPWKLGVILAKNRYVSYAARQFIQLIKANGNHPTE